MNLPRSALFAFALTGCSALHEAEAPESPEPDRAETAGPEAHAPGSRPALDVVQVNAPGEDVADLATVLAPGKITLVDFWATWCEPCHEVDAFIMGTLLPREPDVAYRKIDVGDWVSPVARHYLKGAPEIPYVIVFDARGRRVAVVTGIDPGGLKRAVAKAREASPPHPPAPSPRSWRGGGEHRGLGG